MIESLHVFISYKAILVYMLLTFSGIFNGISDTLAFHYDLSVFPKNSKFWNPAFSYATKYKLPKIFKTMLVWLTDGWHLMKLCQKTCQETAVAILITQVWYEIIIFVLIFKFLIGLFFELFFSKILIR